LLDNPSLLSPLAGQALPVVRLFISAWWCRKDHPEKDGEVPGREFSREKQEEEKPAWNACRGFNGWWLGISDVVTEKQLGEGLIEVSSF